MTHIRSRSHRWCGLVRPQLRYPTLRQFETNSVPASDTPVSSIRPQYRYLRRSGKFSTNSKPVPNTSMRVCGYPTLQYGDAWGMGVFALQKGSGTTSIPVPDTSASSVLTHYRYRVALRFIRYELNTGTRLFGNFGTNSVHRYPTLQ